MAPIIERVALSKEEFHLLKDKIYKMAGILYPESRKETLASRVQKRMRAMKVDTVRGYIDLLSSPSCKEELVNLVEAATTNETYFFRAERHWKLYAETVLPNIKKHLKPGGRIKIWSAAASNGSEAYTAGILATEKMAFSPLGPKIYILATDINRKILEDAKAGAYNARALLKTPPAIQKKYFIKNGEMTKIRDNIKSLVTFRRHNLMDPPPERGFHLIFLRNVLIYFDKTSKEKAFQHISDALIPGGYLFLGESESTVGTKHPFKYIEPSFYQKPE